MEQEQKISSSKKKSGSSRVDKTNITSTSDRSGTQKMASINPKIHRLEDNEPEEIDKKDGNTSYSSYEGATIKNVDGSGYDFTPFVGCDIDDIIANLNNSDSGDLSNNSNNNDTVDVGADLSGYTGIGASEFAASSTQTNSITTKSIIEPIRTPLRDKKYHQFQQNTFQDTEGDNNFKLPHMNSPITPNSRSSALSHVIESPSSVELFKSDAMNNNDDIQTSNQISIPFNSSVHAESLFNNSVIDIDDNSTVLSAVTNTTTMTSKSTKSKASKSRKRRKSRQPEQEQENSQWETFWSSEHDCPYYHNKYTNEVTWENPNQRKIVYEDEHVPIVDYTKQPDVDEKPTEGESDEEKEITTGNVLSSLDSPSANNDVEDTKNNDTSSQSSRSLATTWDRYWSDEHGRDYFHNPHTGEVRWDDPSRRFYTNSSSSIRSGISGQSDGRSNGNSGTEEHYDGNRGVCLSENHYYEDDELVQISDFTSTKININILDESKDDIQLIENNYDFCDSDDDNRQIGAGGDVGNGHYQTPHRNKSNNMKDKRRVELAKTVRHQIKKLHNVLLLLQQQFHEHLLRKNNFDNTKDRPITSADLAYQRRLNLLRKRRRKRMRKRGFIFIILVILASICTQLLGLAFRSKPKLQPDLASFPSASISQSKSLTENEFNGEVQHEETIRTKSINLNGNGANSFSKRAHEVDGSTLETITGSTKGGSTEPNSKAASSLDSSLTQIEELKKLSTSIKESLNLIHSSKMSIDRKESEEIDVLGRKLEELSYILDQVKGDDKKTNLNALKTQEMKNEVKKKSKVGDGVLESTNKNKPSSENKTEKNSDIKDTSQKMSKSKEGEGKAPEEEGFDQEQKSMDSVQVSANPLPEVESNSKVVKNTVHDNKQMTNNLPVASEENELPTFFSRSHYYDKFQTVIQTLVVALDVQLDSYGIGNFENDEKLSQKDKLREDDNLSYQLSKKMPIQAVMQLKKSLPEIQKSLANIIAINSKKAIDSVRNTMDDIGKNEQVIAAKDVVLTSASTLGKKVAKETITYMQTLDYHGLVENGYISETIIFPDTRAMHCQMPVFKRMNKRCVKSNAQETLSRPNDWMTSFRSRMFTKEKVPPSNKGGWSVPIWRACNKESGCQQQTSSSFSESKKALYKWSKVMSKVIPTECKKKRKNGSPVDIECLADFSS